MFDVLHQLIDKVHGWRSEEDRVNAHTAVDEYRAEQEGDTAPSTSAPDESDSQASTGGATADNSSVDLFTPSDKSKG